jgi:hypothetical protein
MASCRGASAVRALLACAASVCLVVTAASCASSAGGRSAEPALASSERARSTAASHELRLHLYTFNGTRWSPETIREAVHASGQLLAQCGIVLNGIEVRTLDTERRFHFYSTPVSRLLLRQLDVPRPAIFFVDDTLNQPAFDAEAIGLANAQSRPELANTIWVAYGARDLPYALAHELVHVLSDSGEHSTETGNLMRAETSARNTALTAAQCERVRARGTANRLITPR